MLGGATGRAPAAIIRTVAGMCESRGVRTGDVAGRVHLPMTQRAPLRAVLRRVGFAIALVIFVALVVRLDRDGYTDVTGDPISMLDAIYYASVTVTTTGYGDITAVTSGTRLATILLITPARIVFLILVVGTTVEVLTEQSRRLLLTKRWRRIVNDHVVICGFGSTGQSAASDLLRRDLGADRIVVVDADQDAVDLATSRGHVAVLGDATKRSVLRGVRLDRARSVVVTPHRDDTAVLVVLTAREINPTVHLVVGVREQENLHLLRQAGADEVIDAPAAVGRMLGFATQAPAALRVLDDLIDAGTGLELVEIDGALPADATLVAIIRDGLRLPQDQVDGASIISGDRLVCLRETGLPESS